MGLTLEPFRENACCLCGSESDLTGEHKIKASALRVEFGNDRMVIGGRTENMRPVQGPKSKALHFSAPMCATCNNSDTSAADLEFDRFHAAARSLLAPGEKPIRAFDDQRYELGSESYLNVFRYFAKLLCCHMAELKVPRRTHVSRFARGLEKENCIWLDVNEDWAYRQAADEAGHFQYAAHGGLAVYGDKTTKLPNAFHSTLTLGPIRYVYHSRLTLVEQIEMAAFHPEFTAWCKSKVEEAVDEPLTETTLLNLGLKPE